MQFTTMLYAQSAILAAEKKSTDLSIGASTQFFRKKAISIFMKIGYHRTGKIEKINEKMGIVFYEKN